jgi:hypothetical protein
VSKTRICIISMLTGMVGFISPSLYSFDVYHWVDEDGVSHYSQVAPTSEIPDVSKQTLEDTTPTDFDPEADLYGVKENARQMEALRAEMDERREAGRERQQQFARQVVPQYQEPERYYSGAIGYPIRPYPPIHNPRPRPELYPEQTPHDPFLPSHSRFPTQSTIPTRSRP